MNEAEKKLAAQKLMANCYMEEGECWPWLGFRNAQGYGRLSWNKKNWAAHRLMYTVAKGPIPDGMLVCHSCDKPPCVNPDHLWLGTDKDNSQDARKKLKFKGQLKTHCKRGHLLDGDNLYYCSAGLRHCKTCHRINQRIRAGWTREQAEKLGVTPFGKRPVNGKFRKKRNAA